MTSERLAQLLEGEGMNAAAEDIRCGQDPATVCADAALLGSRYDDCISHNAIQTLRAVAEDRTTVTDA